MLLPTPPKMVLRSQPRACLGTLQPCCPCPRTLRCEHQAFVAWWVPVSMRGSARLGGDGPWWRWTWEPILSLVSAPAAEGLPWKANHMEKMLLVQPDLFPLVCFSKGSAPLSVPSPTTRAELHLVQLGPLLRSTQTSVQGLTSI